MPEIIEQRGMGLVAGLARLSGSHGEHEDQEREPRRCRNCKGPANPELLGNRMGRPRIWLAPLDYVLNGLAVD